MFAGGWSRLKRGDLPAFWVLGAVRRVRWRRPETRAWHPERRCRTAYRQVRRDKGRNRLDINGIADHSAGRTAADSGRHRAATDQIQHREPGDEAACVHWIRDLLTGARIETRIVAADPRRPNLIARLPGPGIEPRLRLHSHVDVVSVEGQLWSRPPFDGEVVDGELWGRGAVDMKCLASEEDILLHRTASGRSAGRDDRPSERVSASCSERMKQCVHPRGAQTSFRWRGG
jgi:hypothetical protein